MKCKYCKKRIWFWQKHMSFDIHGNARHYHNDCLYHKIAFILIDFGRLTVRSKSIIKATAYLAEGLSGI